MRAFNNLLISKSAVSDNKSESQIHPEVTLTSLTVDTHTQAHQKSPKWTLNINNWMNK